MRRTFQVMVSNGGKFTEISEHYCTLSYFIFRALEDNKIFYFKTQEQADLVSDLFASQWDTLDDDYSNQYIQPCFRFQANVKYAVYDGRFDTLENTIAEMNKTIALFNAVLQS